MFNIKFTFYFADLIKKKNFSKTYHVDEFLMSEGHDVLRLPPYYCILNPIEMVWNQVKVGVRKKNVDPKSVDAMAIIREAVDAVTNQQWANYVGHTKKVEDGFRSVEKREDDDEGQFRIVVNTGSSSESESDLD